MNYFEQDNTFYNFVGNLEGTPTEQYSLLSNFVSGAYPQYRELLHAHSFSQQYDRLSKWLHTQIESGVFEDCSALIIVPRPSGDQTVDLNIYLSTWWDEDESAEWAAADECTLLCNEEFFDGLESLSLDQNGVGNYFCLALSAVAIRAFCHANIQSILNITNQPVLHLAMANYGDIFSFCRLSQNGITPLTPN